MKKLARSVFTLLNLLIIFVLLLGMPATALAAPTYQGQQPQPVQVESLACTRILSRILQVPPLWLEFRTLFRMAVERNCGKAVDYGALVMFYSRTNGSQWLDHTNWLAPNHCSWHGVTCTDGRVTGLALRQNNLGGVLPVELGLIRNLNILDLAHNGITGPIPAELGSLANLTMLDLSDNQLSGNIPASLGNLPSLVYLNLGSNQFRGEIPASLANDAALQTLNLSQNQLVGSIPSALGSLWNLLDLDLSGNQLDGTIPTGLFWNPNLRSLVLSDNQLVGSLPFQYGTYNLVDLDLANNNFTGIIPTEITALGNLEFLDLSGNQFKGSVPPEFGFLSRLSSLDLSNNPLLFGGLPVSLSNLSLDTFAFNDTDICQPNVVAMDDWLASISNLQGTGVTCNIPVIVLPGVMGSRLYNSTWDGLECIGRPNGEVWLDYGNMLLALTFGTLEFKSDGYTPVDTCTNVAARPDTDLTGVQDTYASMIDYLKGQGYVVKFFPYDFRMSLVDVAGSLDKQLTTWGFDEVYLVGHSMGGLLARTYVQLHPERVVKAVSVVTPYLGAPGMAYRMRTGEPPLSLPIHISSDGLWRILRNSPGMMQLLPSRAYFNVAPYYYEDDGTALATYDATTQFFASDYGFYGGQNAGLMQEADAFQQAYVNFSNVTTEYHVLSASNLPTLARINQQWCVPWTACSYQTWVMDGDGTVTIPSAYSLGSHHQNVHIHAPYTIGQTSSDHRDLIKDILVETDVKNILLGTLDGISSAPAPTTNALAQKKFIQLTVNDPDGVGVTDGLGNFIGMDAAGMFVNNIQGATVEQSQNQIDIFLPAGQAYTVNFHQSADDPLQVRMIELVAPSDGGIFDHGRQVLFNDLLIDSGSATLLLDPSIDWDAIMLSIDQDGDGQPDQTVLPMTLPTGQ